MNAKQKIASSLSSTIVALVLTAVGGLSAPVYADTVDLSPTPPDLTTSVAPNIALSFDDSGSMSFGYMPDGHTSCSWKYAWVGYNTVYYNPQVTYTPPLHADGTAFDDIPFNSAPLDGFHDYLGFGGSTIDLATEYRLTKEWDRDADEDNNTLSTTCIPDSVKVTTGTGEKKTTVYHAYYTEADGTAVDLTTITTGATVNGVTRTVAQEQQNFANWYSYYRTRSLMTKTAISQAFGTLTTDIQMIWQTIWPKSKSRTWGATITKGSTTIGDFSGTRKTDFFDWLFKLRSSNGTPDRAATVRASEYFESNGGGDDKDPYWNGLSGADSLELTCRRNFHVLVTDGYWNNSVSHDPSSKADEMTATPDGRAKKVDQSSIFWNVDDTFDKSMANIAYDFWARDLSSLADDVPRYLEDASHNLWPGEDFDPTDPWANDEVYFNPRNDPATWQHVSQFIVTLGIDGNRSYPGDLEDLRKGDLKWPKAVGDTAAAIDDMWRAALVSRGGYFSASDPTKLGLSLANIIRSVAARTGSAVANTVNSGVVTSQSVAYSGLYNSASWNGSVKAHKLVLVPVKSKTGRILRMESKLGQELWDADCLLTGDGCISGGKTIINPTNPSDRVIFTSAGSGAGSTDFGAGKGVTFEWANLSLSEKQALDADPATDMHASTIVTDGRGQQRLEWLRGDRTNEGITMRSRTSVMGAVIRSQPLYVAYPDNNYRDNFPDAVVGGVAKTAPENAKPYQDFVKKYKDRTPTLYVGANDGMMHALEAESGKELFAYVPASVYWRSPPIKKKGAPDKPGVPNLGKLTAYSGYQFAPTVDNTPVKRDVFFDDEWHTLLVGTLGMGGRGVYALDITEDPSTIDSSSAASTVLWEFNPSMTDATSNLGYTFGQAAISRLANGKWAVLVPGGYFPKDKEDPNHAVDGATRKYSSLFVLDAETGALIRELKTPTTYAGKSVVSFGLSTPVAGDYQDDQVDDVAFAGDLAGNLWRFDLSDSTPSNWTIDLVYQGNVSSGGAEDGNVPSGEPTQPISVKPRLFPDPVTNQFIVVFGTGKYLGIEDRLRTGTPTQYIMGIREQGSSTSASFPKSYYPIAKSKLVEQEMDRDGNARMLTNHDVPGGATGWVIKLDDRLGERVVQRAGALFNSNQALMTTLIPSGNDPCNPNREGAQILISAVTGGAGNGIDSLKEDHPDTGTGTNIKRVVGVEFPTTGGGGGGKNTLPSTGDSGSVQPVLLEPGGCRGVAASGLNIPMPCWRRRSWKILN